MSLFRLYLIAMLIILSVYTSFIIANHGLGLIPPFFSEIFAMTWQGQFNLDFMGFLSLSALWVAWRNNFSPLGLGLGLIAFTGGIPFLTIYLLITLKQAEGDMQRVLMGNR